MVALRILRSELTSPDTAVSLRVYRSDMTVDTTAAAQAVRLRVLRSELTTLPGVVLPATVAADSFKLVSLVATMEDGSKPTSWQWEQTAGATLSTSGGGTSVLSFTAPPSTSAQTYTFRARAVIGGTFTDWTSSSVTVARHRLWYSQTGPLETDLDRAQLTAVPPQPGESTQTPPVDPGPVDPTVPPPTGTPTAGLFFQLRTDLATFDRKSLPHLFPPYVQDFNNNGGTTYETNYNKVNGSATYTPDGGFIRNRPIPVAPRPTLANTENLIRNAKLDIEAAIGAGHDGFFCEILGQSGGNYDRLTAYRSAAASYPGFLLVPMIDANGATGIAVRGQTTPTVVAKDPVAVANQMKLYLNLPSTYRLPNGRFLIATFKHEGNTAADWQAVLDNMGTPSALGGVFLDYTGKSPAYASQLALGFGGSWGYGGDPVPISRAGSQANLAHSRGQLWCEAINAQNVRPNQEWWEEAAGTEAFVQSWQLAIRTGADFAEDVTWSDYSEGGETQPSVQNGYALCDLGAYYRTKWKTGTYPTILRDAAYVSYRNQFVTPAGGYQFVSTTPMKQRVDRNGFTTPQDIVEVRTFCTAPRTVTVTQRPPGAGADIVTTYDAPKGEFRKTIPLQLGHVSVVVYNGTTPTTQIQPLIPVLNQPVNQDLNYYRFSSLRGTAGYFVPSNINGTIVRPGPNPIPAAV